MTRYSAKDVRGAYLKERTIAVLLHCQTRDNFAMGFGEPPLEPITEWPPMNFLTQLRVAGQGLANFPVFALAIVGTLGILGEIFLGMGVYVAVVPLVVLGAVFRKVAGQGRSLA